MAQQQSIAQPSAILKIAFSPDGSVIGALDSDGDIHLWAFDTASLSVTAEWQATSHTKTRFYRNYAHMSMSNEFLVLSEFENKGDDCTGNELGNILLFKLHANNLTIVEDTRLGFIYGTAAFNRDGSKLFVCSDPVVHIYDVNSWSVQKLDFHLGIHDDISRCKTVEGSLFTKLLEHSHLVQYVDFTQCTVSLTNLQTAREISIGANIKPKFTGLDRNGQLLLMGGDSGKFRLWIAATNLTVFEVEIDFVQDIADVFVDSARSEVYIATNAEYIRVDLYSGRIIGRSKFSQQHAETLIFHPTGELIAATIPPTVVTVKSDQNLIALEKPLVRLAVGSPFELPNSGLVLEVERNNVVSAKFPVGKVPCGLDLGEAHCTFATSTCLEDTSFVLVNKALVTVWRFTGGIAGMNCVTLLYWRAIDDNPDVDVQSAVITEFKDYLLLKLTLSSLETPICFEIPRELDAYSPTKFRGAIEALKWLPAIYHNRLNYDAVLQHTKQYFLKTLEQAAKLDKNLGCFSSVDGILFPFQLLINFLATYHEHEGRIHGIIKTVLSHNKWIPLCDLDGVSALEAAIYKDKLSIAETILKYIIMHVVESDRIEFSATSIVPVLPHVQKHYPDILRLLMQRVSYKKCPYDFFSASELSDHGIMRKTFRGTIDDLYPCVRQVPCLVKKYPVWRAFCDTVDQLAVKPTRALYSQLAVQGFWRYVTNIWNWFDVLAYALPVVCVVVDTIGPDNTNSGWNLADALESYAVLFLWIHALLELRIFRQLGIFIAVLIEFMKKIVAFLIVLFAIILAFAHALHLLLRKTTMGQESDNAYTNFWTSLSSVWFFTVGDYSSISAYATSDPVYGMTVFYWRNALRNNIIL
ncbi:hypothetical protein BC938DRAFT_482084 [Jimgerdemannia flammicorona]|uniref:Ion transport domain-containing protein n=1 Tax=Jimgerdemannia flammicorona TaxID=994334 RepID=A0A433QEP7_9FUNG|nr:hypothetical protein BC938DRAFT_482084 [Jimgerdemannia flammicorona]